MTFVRQPPPWYDLPLAELPLVFFDVETTGLEAADGHRIVELALARQWHGTLQAAFETLVNPERDIDHGAQAVHGLDAATLMQAPRFAQVQAQVCDLLHDAVLVAHNAPFDVSFLNHELRRAGQPPLHPPMLDTLVLARRLLHCKAYNLTALATSLGLQHRPTHRAMQDVLTLRDLFMYLAERLAEQEHLTTLNEVLRFQRGLRPGDPEPTVPPLIAQAIIERRRMRVLYRSRSTPQGIQREILPLEVIQEAYGLNVRAYCYYRGDVRVFALKKIDEIELLDSLPATADPISG